MVRTKRSLRIDRETGNGSHVSVTTPVLMMPPRVSLVVDADVRTITCQILPRMQLVVLAAELVRWSLWRLSSVVVDSGICKSCAALHSYASAQQAVSLGLYSILVPTWFPETDETTRRSKQ